MVKRAKAKAAPRVDAARALDLAAGLAGLMVAAAIYAPRLPASTDMLLPRRAGGAVLLAFARMLHRPWAPAALSWAALAGVALCAAALLWSVAARAQAKTLRALSTKKTALRAVLAVAGAAALAALARAALAVWLDVVENAWFMPEALDWREAALLAALFVGVFVCALRAACEFASWALLSPTRASSGAWARPAGRVALAGLLALVLARGLYDAGAPDMSAALGAPLEEHPGVVAVFSGDDGGPQAKVLSVSTADGEIPAIEAFLERRPRSVYARAALHRLYSACAVLMDAPCLRRTLLRGVRAGDAYARLMLLDHLQSASAGEDARLALTALADEGRVRVGARAAARLSLAWARQGDVPAARSWLARASQGEGALPPGLVELPAKPGPLRGGRVSGRLRSPWAATVALYVRAHPRQPSILGPGQLAATSLPRKDGRFRFEGLPAGDYYLAVRAAPAREFSPERVRALGRRGDLTLSRRRPSIDGVTLELRD